LRLARRQHADHCIQSSEDDIARLRSRRVGREKPGIEVPGDTRTVPCMRWFQIGNLIEAAVRQWMMRCTDRAVRAHFPAVKLREPRFAEIGTRRARRRRQRPFSSSRARQVTVIVECGTVIPGCAARIRAALGEEMSLRTHEPARSSTGASRRTGLRGAHQDASQSAGPNTRHQHAPA